MSHYGTPIKTIGIKTLTGENKRLHPVRRLVNAALMKGMRLGDISQMRGSR